MPVVPVSSHSLREARSFFVTWDTIRPIVSRSTAWPADPLPDVLSDSDALLMREARFIEDF